MCFSKEASLTAWVAAVGISFYLYQRNRNYDRMNAAFIVTFSSIQLLEAGIWFSLEKHNSDLNTTLTSLVLLVLLLQPLIQVWMGAKYTHALLLDLLVYVYLGALLWGLFRVATANPGQFSSQPGPNGHLVWTNAKSPSFLGPTVIAMLYLVGLFVPLLFMKEGRGVALLVVGVATLVGSLIYAPGKEFSSIWCYAAIAYAVMALIV
jgi:hypothetical protein